MCAGIVGCFAAGPAQSLTQPTGSCMLTGGHGLGQRRPRAFNAKLHSLEEMQSPGWKPPAFLTGEHWELQSPAMSCQRHSPNPARRWRQGLT